MNPKIKQRWVAALRSGEYAPLRDALAALADVPGQPKERCCLGVLCDLAMEDGVVTKDCGNYVGNQIGDWSDSHLPRAVVEWAGLDGPSPTLPMNLGPEDDGMDYAGAELAELNDGGTSWEVIAALIEERL
jgi:hypothetical protein